MPCSGIVVLSSAEQKMMAGGVRDVNLQVVGVFGHHFVGRVLSKHTPGKRLVQDNRRIKQNLKIWSVLISGEVVGRSSGQMSPAEKPMIPTLCLSIPHSSAFSRISMIACCTSLRGASK